MLATWEYAAGVRLLRMIALIAVGFMAGMSAAAALVKRSLPSRGDPSSDEVALVAVFDGIALESRSSAFRGGSMLSWFGGIAVDLRGAQLAPDAHLDVHSLFGGLAIRVPPGWRIESSVKALGGGLAIGVPEVDDLDSATLTLDGFAVFGGVAVGAKPGAAEPES